MVKVVIFGCRRITVDIINYIVSNCYDKCKITGVVTHDEERDRVYGQDLVYEHCDKMGIPWVRFNGKIDKSIIDGFSPDLIFSTYYRKILKKAS